MALRKARESRTLEYTVSHGSLPEYKSYTVVKQDKLLAVA